ncbi:ABC transporter substrate-binding protein [Teichococcus vastitatis]|uniref:ABC transporter substrate-binding protein n=1 Tax=Teichococcus vastitatis TaxID=2307076 RepID=A0ABS9W4Y9_9PROT|nr:ABC transporter substrate-binding protein [Pseudoroseomonas vastitatis]MCI0753915.1 ABC transporter substrate-binding protein [Pseudoroseomonas vastitatis]
MQRRQLLLASGAALGGSRLAAPGLAWAQNSKVLRFVPQADLPNLDPVAGTQLVVRNASLLVYDMLYGIGADLQPKPQMVERHEIGADGKDWRFTLRAGLRFHDGEPVLARDAVASIRRWMPRDGMGQMIQARLDMLEAVDDRSFRLRLKQPFPKLLYAFGKSNTPLLVVMPERIANTDPYTQVKEYVGSGPMRFRRDEWMAGSRAVFETFAGYRPREEAADWLAGGKRMMLDRVEWLTMPDPGTALGAIQNGEIDWWESPIADLVPVMQNNRQIRVEIADPLGNVGAMRLNHLIPPFNNQLVRQALQYAVNQEDYMRALVGDDEALWKRMPSFFTPGTPGYTEAGAGALKGPRQYDKARDLLKQGGYQGEKVVMLVAADVPITKAQGDVTADMLGRIGMNVDYQALDWGTVGGRRTSRKPVSDGGWNIFFSWHSGADCINPAPYKGVSASGDKAWFGWPSDERVEQHIAEWYDAPDAASEKAALEGVNRAGMEAVTYIPTGFFLGYTASRTAVRNIQHAPFPLFWGASKA